MSRPLLIEAWRNVWPMLRKATKKWLPARVDALRTHWKAHHRLPLIKPVTFNDKVLHRILFDRRTLLTQLADKANARCYVESRLGQELLPKCYYLTDCPETIPFDTLPTKFAVKATHGSGWVHLVPDSSTVDRKVLLEYCKSWLSQSYFTHTHEWPYKDIKPRIIIEELIEGDNGDTPNDYKVFVFDGTPEFIQVDTGRFTEHRRSLYTLTWEKMGISLGPYPSTDDIQRPPHLPEMLAAAHVLGEGIDFIRVDFYDTPRRLYFGEFTTTPCRGQDLFNPAVFDRYLGGRWKVRTR